MDSTARHSQAAQISFTLARGIEHLLPWLVLVILLIYTYLELFATPYLGFNFNPSTGAVQAVYVNLPVPSLQVGDELVQVGQQSVATWKNELRHPLFLGARQGQNLSLAVRRAGQLEHITWRVAGPNSGEIFSRVTNIWWLGYLFWIAGIATLLLVRPKDSQYWLLAAFFFLAAVWLVSGNTSRWRLWDSALVYRSVIWLFAPVTLHMHWRFPKPLANVPLPLLWIIYAVSAAAAVLQWFEWLPPNSFAVALAVALTGSMAMLPAHYALQPAYRNRLRLLLFAYLFALLPVIGLSVASALEAIPSSGPAALLALPLIPAAYFYTIYRFRPGDVELRANRLLSLYLYLILIGSLTTVLVACANMLLDWPGKLFWISIGVSLAATLMGTLAFPPFQGLVERRLLAVPLPPAGILQAYAARITMSLTQVDLVRLLNDEILPSMLIDQWALFGIEYDRLTADLQRAKRYPPCHQLTPMWLRTLASTGIVMSQAMNIAAMLQIHRYPTILPGYG